MNINNYYQYNTANFTGKISITKVKKLIEDGKSIKEISKITGVSTGSLYQLLKNFDIQTPKQLKMQKAAEQRFKNLAIKKAEKDVAAQKVNEQINKIKLMIAKGMSITEISNATGIKEGKLYFTLKSHNILTPTKRKEDFAKETIPQLIQENKNRNAISKETGLGWCFIDRWISRNKGKDFLKNKREMLVKLLTTNSSDKDIAEATGESIHKIRDIRHRLGLNANKIRNNILNKEISIKLSEGLNQREIAQKLNISKGTVSRHIAQINKLDVEG